MRAACLLLVTSGCFSGSPKPEPLPKPNVPSDPPIVLATVIGKSVIVYAVSPTKTTELRNVALPSNVVDLVWFGADPIALLERPDPDRCAMPEDFYRTRGEYEAAIDACEFDPTYDGMIVRVTANSFEPFAALPASTWSALTPPDASQFACETGCWSMEVRDDGLYQGHCIAAFSADGMSICDDFAYGKVAALPPRSPSSPIGPKVAVKPSPRVTIERIAVPHPYEERTIDQVRCAMGSATSTYPDLDKIDEGMSETIEWITTDPPRFLAYHGHPGMTGYSDTVLFENCAPRVIEDVVTSPDGVQIVDGILYRNGVRLGEANIGKLVAWP